MAHGFRVIFDGEHDGRGRKVVGVEMEKIFDVFVEKSVCLLVG